MPLRIYTDPNHDRADARPHWTDIVRAHWMDKSKSEHHPVYGRYLALFELVSAIEEADLCVLPMDWNYYLETGRTPEALQFAETARRQGKPVAIWAMGDYPARIPMSDILLFQCSLYRSSRIGQHQRQYGFPAFFDDYAPLYFNNQLTFREKGSKPVVGFCGQAVGINAQTCLIALRNAYQSVASHLGRLPWESSPLLPSQWLRMRTLQMLARSSAVETNFILRDKYWAGIRSGAERKLPQNKAKREFIDNICHSDYTVCVRGEGNFSKRLYETLNLGRLPIFVDTDCALPYDFAIDWKKYCVWVDQSEIPFIAEKVADFHARLSPGDFLELQHECRKLWEERLSDVGFYSHFHEHLRSVASGV